MITHKGFYDNLEFISLDEKIQIICTMNPPSTLGRYQISSRCTAHMRIINVEYPSAESLEFIYDSICENDISKILILFYQEILGNFDSNEFRHYKFSPKDISRIVFQIQRYK